MLRSFVLPLAALAAACALTLLASPAPARALTNCGGAEHPDNDVEELAFLDIINSYRDRHGLQRLTISTNLNREAMWMVQDMASNHSFGHYDSLGRHPWVRSVDCGYPIPAGENLAAGWRQGGAQGAFDLFQSSPTHNTNMLFPGYRQIGIARVYDAGSPYGWYWATEFGTTDDGAAPEREAVPTFTPAPVEQRSEVARAWTQVVWRQPAATPQALLEREQHAAGESIVYRFDTRAGAWRHFAPRLPAFVNTLDDVDGGASYLVVPLDR